MRKVLLIDDDNGIHETMKILFARNLQECQLLQAKNGKEGLGILVKEENIKLIILDYLMPIMDGLEMLKIVKIAFPDIPVLMMSGTEEIEIKALEHGADRFITKPFPDEFAQTIRETINRKKKPNT